MARDRLRLSPDWSEDELILALTACPRGELQSYSSTSPSVVELADLLGRSPGSVSLHFANIYSVRTHGRRGYKNAGKLVRDVVERWDGRHEELLKEAELIRDRLLGTSASPRIERRISPESDLQFRERVDSALSAFGANRPRLLVYRREGSYWIGLLIYIEDALKDPATTAAVAVELLTLFGREIKASIGFWAARRKDEDKHARLAIRQKLPEFDPEELSRADRRRLALRLATLGFGKIKLTDTLRKRFGQMNESEERRRVKTYLGIDASTITREGLLLLLGVIESMIRSK